MINSRIAIIGCGNMGGALAKGIVSRGVTPSENIGVCDLDSSKEEELAAEIKCRRGDLSDMLRSSDMLIISVKPDDFASLAEEIAAGMRRQTLVSVMAGTRIKDIARMLGRETAIIRAMPNVAASVGQSMTCMAVNDLVAEPVKETAKNIFSSIGEVAEIDESYMDAVTAVSGSGPAYLFYLAQAMMTSAEAQGLSREISRKLVEQTLYGAALLIKDSRLTPSELVAKVASRGGTTEAALSVFRDGSLEETVIKAIDSARKRSEELSGGGKGGHVHNG